MNRNRWEYIIEVHKLTPKRDTVISVIHNVYRNRRRVEQIVSSLNDQYLGQKYFTYREITHT